jgi:hypothetical protein
MKNNNIITIKNMAMNFGPQYPTDHGRWHFTFIYLRMVFIIIVMFKLQIGQVLAMEDMPGITPVPLVDIPIQVNGAIPGLRPIGLLVNGALLGLPINAHMLLGDGIVPPNAVLFNRLDLLAIMQPNALQALGINNLNNQLEIGHFLYLYNPVNNYDPINITINISSFQESFISIQSNTPAGNTIESTNEFKKIFIDNSKYFFLLKMIFIIYIIYVKKHLWYFKITCEG